MKPRKKDPEPASISVLIVDEYPIVRYGVIRLLEGELNKHVVGDTASCKTAEDILRNHASVDLLLIDIQLRRECAHTLITKVIELYPTTRILVYSALTEDHQIIDALRHGAHGYITKDAEPDRLIEAISLVVSGGSYIDPAIASKVIGHVGRINERRTLNSRELTQRESAVLKGIASGKRSQDIAVDLYISERTVKYHLSSIFTKMRVHNRAEAVRYAYERGLL